ncbi:hypothetical protein AB8O38_04900 [Saccharomonospora xinjiangensis]|uniref:hypothetical protein n=1 Tax=Saccharomonospora xinjiangensis TaxID=75294 RepID=UPI003510C473
MNSFWLPPDSPPAASIGEDWAPIPLRVPAEWTVHKNAIVARRLPSGRYEVNDSEDLFWASKRPPAGEREDIHLDAAWYGSRFRLVVFVRDWDHIRRDLSTTDLGEFITTLESWLACSDG